MYKPKKIDAKWHAVNQEGWTSLICEKKSTAKMVCNLLNEIKFDEITNVKRAKMIHDQIAGIAQSFDKVKLF